MSSDRSVWWTEVSRADGRCGVDWWFSTDRDGTAVCVRAGKRDVQPAANWGRACSVTGADRSTSVTQIPTSIVLQPRP